MALLSFLDREQSIAHLRDTAAGFVRAMIHGPFSQRLRGLLDTEIKTIVVSTAGIEALATSRTSEFAIHLRIYT